MADEKLTRSPSELLYIKCRQYIDKHYLHLNTIDEVADAMELSKAHLCRIFKQFGTSSPYQYLTHLKMLYAEQQLQNSDDKLKDIARKLGYADQFVFSKAFKRTTGLSPRSYRKKQ